MLLLNVGQLFAITQDEARRVVDYLRRIVRIESIWTALPRIHRNDFDEKVLPLLPRWFAYFHMRLLLLFQQITVLLAFFCGLTQSLG